jgi:hypothetical protein
MKVNGPDQGGTCVCVHCRKALVAVRSTLNRMQNAMKARRKTAMQSNHHSKLLCVHALAAWSQYSRHVDKKRRGLHAVSSRSQRAHQIFARCLAWSTCYMHTCKYLARAH